MGQRMSLDPVTDVYPYLYPAFFSYLLLVLFGIYFTLGYVSGIFTGVTDFAIEFLIEPSNFYLIGRSASLIFSLLIIPLFYRYLSKYHDKSTGKAAAVIIALSTYFSLYSGYATQESMMILFCSLATIQIMVIQKSPSTKSFVLAGMFCGFAIGLKYNAAVVVLGILVVYFQNYKSVKKTLLAAIAAIIISFIIVNPYWVIKPGEFLAGYSYISEQAYSGVSYERGINYIWEITELIKNELLIGVLFMGAVFFGIKSDLKKNLPYLSIILVSFL